MDRWIKVADAGEIELGTGRTVSEDGLRLALFNEGGRFFTLDDACPRETHEPVRSYPTRREFGAVKINLSAD